MSVPAPSNSAQAVRVDIHQPRRHTYGPYIDYQQNDRGKHTKSDFVYVNNAYTGSVNSVNANRLYEPPTTVIREQYWACSKWSFAQRALALAVGVLLGTVISLAIIIALKGDEDKITNIFRSHAAPD